MSVFFSISDSDWLIYLFVFSSLLFCSFSFDFFALSRLFAGRVAVIPFPSTRAQATMRFCDPSFFRRTHCLNAPKLSVHGRASRMSECFAFYLCHSYPFADSFRHSQCVCVFVCSGVGDSLSDCEWICVRRFFCFESNSFALLHGVNQNKFIYLWFRTFCLFHCRLHEPTEKKEEKKTRHSARAHSGECIIHGNTLWIVLEKFAQPEFGIVSFNPIWNWIRVDILDAFLLLTPVVADDLMTLDSGDSVTICALQVTCAIIISLSFIRSFRR